MKKKKQSELFISDGITTINTEAFSNCGALKKITIPRTVINIRSDIFRGCRLLKSDGVINNLGVLFDWRVNHHIYKDKTLNQITIYCKNNWCNAFSGCYHLKEVVIPNVTTIEAFVFMHVVLKLSIMLVILILKWC